MAAFGKLAVAVPGRARSESVASGVVSILLRTLMSQFLHLLRLPTQLSRVSRPWSRFYRKERLKISRYVATKKRRQIPLRCHASTQLSRHQTMQLVSEKRLPPMTECNDLQTEFLQNSDCFSNSLIRVMSVDLESVLYFVQKELQ